jgi:hypothetical protein
MSSKEMFDEEVKYSSKKINRYEDIGIYGFLKGDGTIPLVSEPTAWGVRNENLLEVYERLKFFAKEWYRARQSREIILVKALKEIELYLKIYENEQEDSDWDSDEEWGCISIAKELRAVIEEKTDCDNELNEVERNLIAVNSNKSNEQGDYSHNSTIERNRSTSPINAQDISLITEGTLTDKDHNTKAKLVNEDKDHSLYKNVLKKGYNSSSNNGVETKSQSFRIDWFLPFENNNDNAPSTPTIKPDKEIYKSRQHRKLSEFYSFTPRSSSIQSVRSNNNVCRNKKVKAKKKTGKNLRESKKSKDWESEFSDSSDSYPEIDKSPRSATLKKKGNPEKGCLNDDSKFFKGKSSFAKLSGNKKKTSRRKVRKFKTNNEESNRFIKKKKQMSNNSITKHEAPPHEQNKKEEEIISKVEKKSSLTSRLSGNSKDLLPKDEMTNPKDYVNRKAAYLKTGRHNSTIHQANSFMSVFNSFVGDETKHKNRTRRSSILLHVRNSSSKEIANELRNPKPMRSRKFSKNRLYLLSIYKKNRSKSEVIGKGQEEKKLARTLSDFHECVKAQNFIDTDIFCEK